jgi:predicted amidophosphoribosyltransferase
MSDPRPDSLIYRHNQMILAWSRVHGTGSPKCSACSAETASWWIYCATCGHSLAARASGQGAPAAKEGQ